MKQIENINSFNDFFLILLEHYLMLEPVIRLGRGAFEEYSIMIDDNITPHTVRSVRNTL